MTTQQILNLTQKELERMTEKELRKAVSVLRSTSRKRYERLVEADVYSQSAIALHRSSSGGIFSDGIMGIFPSVKNMDTITLLNEQKRYKQFLMSKTSTVKGARKTTNKTKKLIEDLSGGKEFTDEEITEIFVMADELKNEMNVLQSSTDRISAISEVYDPDLSKDEIMTRAREKMVEIYENDNPTIGESGLYPSKYID